MKRYLPLLAKITDLNFYVKCENTFISETVPDKVIGQILALRIYADFVKNRFPAILGGHLEIPH